jgi:hypothetical protein
MLLLSEFPSLNEVMDRVEGEEARHVVMGSQPIADPKAKTMAATR